MLKLYYDRLKVYFRLVQSNIYEINKPEAFFYLESSEYIKRNKPFDLPENIIIKKYSKANEITSNFLVKLASLYTDNHLEHWLNKNLDNKGSIWIIEKEEDILGYHWTFPNNFHIFRLFPLCCNDALIAKAYIFPRYRGQGFWPLLINFTIFKLIDEGVKRIYIATRIDNTQSLKAIGKMDFHKVGVGRPLSFFGKKVTVWSIIGCIPQIIEVI